MNPQISRTPNSSRLAFFVLAMGILSLEARAQVGLGLSPMRLEFSATPGSAQSGPLTLSNESNEPVRVRAELLDFYIDDNQTPQFASQYPSEAETSCGKWLSLNPMETEVPPRSSVVVRYTLRAPQSAGPRSYHCAAGFTALPVAEQLTGTGLRTAIRMVAAFYAVVGKPAIEGNVTKMNLQSVKSNGAAEWRAAVLVTNSGLRYFRALGELALLDDNGAILETARFPSLPVLPKREQRFVFPLSKVQPNGRYTLRTRLDIGGAQIQETLATVVAEDREE